MDFTQDTITSPVEPNFIQDKTPDLRGYSTPTPTPGPINGNGSGQSIENTFNQLFTTPDPKTQLEPVTFNWDESNADRYVHSKYNPTEGFDPRLGPINEYNYGQSQGWFDQFRNGFAGMGVGAWKAAKDQFLGWKDALTVFSHPDLSEAFHQDELEQLNKKNKAFENNYPIFKSESDDNSFFSWANFMKKVQDVGPIVGSVAELVAEEAATQLIVGATFGTAAPLEGVEGVRAGGVLSRLGKSVDQGKVLLNADLSAYAKSTRRAEELTDALNGTEQVNKFWGGIGKTATDITNGISNLLPVSGTAKFLVNDLKYAKDAGFVRTALKGFGSVYSDLRHLNLAVSMASSNAAGQYQESQNKLTEDYKKTHGGQEPDAVATEEIKNKAFQASKTSGALNALAILYTNRLAFGNILKPNKALSEFLQNTEEGVSKNIGINPDYIAEKTGEKLFVKSNKWLSFKANMYALPIEMATHGLGFAATMSVMNTVDEAVKSFYNAKYANEHLDGWGAIAKGIDKQFTKEGAQSFISSFLTGALALGVGGKLLDQARINPDAIFNRKAYGERIVGDRAVAEDVVNTVNDAWKNWNSPIKNNIHDLVLQSNLSATKDQSISASNKDGFHDAQDDALRLLVLKAAKNGLSDIYLKRVQDQMTNLKPEQLCEAFELSYSEENYKELKSQLEDFTKRSKDLSDIYKEVKRKFPNKAKPWNYEKGSDEYNNELAKFGFHNDALDYLVWVKDIAQRDLERQSHILNGNPADPTSTGLNSIKGFKDLGESTLYTLTNTSFLTKELETLHAELAATGTEDAASKKQHEFITNKIKLLEGYHTDLKDYTERLTKILSNPDATKQIEEHQKLRQEFQPKTDEHLGNITDHELKHNDKEPVAIDDLAKGSKMMLDYIDLSVKGGNALKAANVLLHPEIADRFFQSFQKHGAEQKASYESYEEPKQENKQESQVVSEEPKEETTTIVEPTVDKSQELAKEKTDQQRQYLQDLVKDTASKLEDLKNSRETRQIDINNAEQSLKDLRDKLKEVETKLSAVDLSKKGKKSNAVKELLKMKEELPSKISAIENLLDKFKQDRAGLEQQQETLTKYNDMYQQSLKEIQDTNMFIDIDKKLQKYRQERGTLSPVEEANKFIVDAKGQVEILTKDIKSLQTVVDDTKSLLQKLIKYDDIYQTLAGLKTYGDYRKELYRLYTDAKNEGDKEKVEYISKLSRALAKLDEGTPKSDIDEKLDENTLATLVSLFHGLKEEIEKLTEKRDNNLSQIQEFGNNIRNIGDLDSKIDYFNHLKGAFEEKVEQEKAQNTTFDYSEYKNGEDGKYITSQVSSDPIVVVNENQIEAEIYKNKATFVPGILLQTVSRTHEPAHYQVTTAGLTKRPVVRYKLERDQNQQFQLSSGSLEQDHPLGSESKKHYEGIKRALDKQYILNHQDLDADKPVSITYEGKQLEVRRFKNDEIIHEEDGTKLFGKAADDINLDFSGKEPIFGLITYTGYDPFGIRNTEAYPDDIKIMLTNKKGEFIDKHKKKIETPSKDNILYTSIPGNTKLLSGDLLNPTTKDMDEALKYMRTRYETKHAREADLVNEIMQYRKVIHSLREQIKSGKGGQLKVKIEGKTTGVPEFAARVTDAAGNQVVPKNPLQGRLITDSKNFTQLYHPNGQKIALVINPTGTYSMLREDQQSVSVYNRPLSDKEKENLANALEYSLNIKAPNKERDTQKTTDSPILIKMLHTQLFFGVPEDISNPGKNRIWIQNGLVFVTDNKAQIKSYRRGTIKANIAEIMQNKYHNINSQEWVNVNQPYVEHEITQTSSGFEIKPIKTWKNYREYILNSDNRQPILHTNMTTWVDDGRPQNKQRDLIWQPLGLDTKVEPKPAEQSKPQPFVSKSVPTQQPISDKNSPAQKAYDDAIAAIERVGKRADGGIDINRLKPGKEQMDFAETLLKAGLGIGDGIDKTIDHILNGTLEPSNNHPGIKNILKSVLESRQYKEQEQQPAEKTKPQELPGKTVSDSVKKTYADDFFENKFPTIEKAAELYKEDGFETEIDKNVIILINYPKPDIQLKTYIRTATNGKFLEVMDMKAETFKIDPKEAKEVVESIIEPVEPKIIDTPNPDLDTKIKDFIANMPTDGDASEFNPDEFKDC